MTSKELTKLACSSVNAFFRKKKLIAQREIEILDFKYGDEKLQYLIFRVNKEHDRFIKYSGYMTDTYVYYFSEMSGAYATSRLFYIVSFGYFNNYLDEDYARYLLGQNMGELIGGDLE